MKEGEDISLVFLHFSGAWIMGHISHTAILEIKSSYVV